MDTTDILPEDKETVVTKDTKGRTKVKNYEDGKLVSGGGSGTKTQEQFDKEQKEGDKNYVRTQKEFDQEQAEGDKISGDAPKDKESDEQAIISVLLDLLLGSLMDDVDGDNKDIKGKLGSEEEEERRGKQETDEKGHLKNVDTTGLEKTQSWLKGNYDDLVPKSLLENPDLGVSADEIQKIAKEVGLTPDVVDDILVRTGAFTGEEKKLGEVYQDKIVKVKDILPIDKSFSIVDYLDRAGLPFQQSDRVELAKALGIEDYRFTAAQNLYILSKIKGMEREEVMEMIQQGQYYKG